MSRIAGLLFGLGVMGLAMSASAAEYAIVGARVYPSPDAQPIADAVILIRDGQIRAVGARGKTPVPPGYEVLDRSGTVVTSGFWNSHVHLVTPELLHPDQLSDERLTAIMESLFTRWGFTTVFDLASTMESTDTIRKRISSRGIPAPAILTVGAPFYPPGGTPVYAVEIYREHNLPSAEIDSTKAAVDRVARQVEAGADGVKLFTGAIIGGEIGVLPMSAEHVSAIAAEAHRLERPVFAHPTNQSGLDAAIDNGVDILAHVAPLTGPWTPEFVQRLTSRDIALVPTLTLFKVFADDKTPMKTALQQVKALADAGGDILFGTDVGFMEVADTTEEFRLMGQVLDWRAILASLTVNPASRFGMADQTGRVAAGMKADLVILDGDPASDVTAFARVRETIRSGEIIYRQAP